MVTLLSVAWVAATFRSPPRSLGAYSLVTLFGIYSANAFVPHIFGAFVLRAYDPGLITAAFAVVPYTLLFVSTGLRDSRYTARGVAVALTVALALYACAGITARWDPCGHAQARVPNQAMQRTPTRSVASFSDD